MQAGAPRSRTFTFGGERNFARQCGSRAQRRRCPRSQRGHTVGRLPTSNGLPARTLVPRRLARFLQYLANRDFFRTRLLGWLRRVFHLRKRGAAPCEQEAFWMAKSTPAPRVEGHGGLSVKKTCFDEPLRPPEDCPDRAQVRNKPRIGPESERPRLGGGSSADIYSKFQPSENLDLGTSVLGTSVQIFCEPLFLGGRCAPRIRPFYVPEQLLARDRPSSIRLRRSPPF